MKINKKKSKKTLIIVLACVVALGAAGGALLYFNKKNSDSKGSSINYGPPTEAEKNASQDAKKRLLEESQKEQGSTSESTGSNETTTPEQSKKNALINVSFADVADGNLEVRAFTPTAIEGDGTCTIKATRGDKTITKQVSGFIDARSTICTPVFIPVSQLSQGTWDVSIAYSSAAYTGTSGIIKVEVK